MFESIIVFSGYMCFARKNVCLNHIAAEAYVIFLPTENNVRCDIFERKKGGKVQLLSRKCRLYRQTYIFINIVEENDLILHHLVLS